MKSLRSSLFDAFQLGLSSRTLSLFALLGMLLVFGNSSASDKTDRSGQQAHPGASTGPQELDFGKGNSIPFQSIKAEAKAPIAFNSEQEYQLRLKSGGT